MQHVYGHNGNLGNECADHAAALWTFGLTSSHNVATRWIHNNFDASVYIDGCHNISEFLERLQHIRTDAIVAFTKIGVSVVFTIGFIVFLVHLTRFFITLVFLSLSFPYCTWVLCSLEQVMESFSSSVSTVPSFEDAFSHNMSNLLLELLFHEQVSGIFEPSVDEIDLAKITLSCHFALDLLC